MQNAGLIRELLPHARHTKEVPPQIGLGNVCGQDSTLRCQAPTHEPKRFHVAWLAHSAPPNRRERSHLSVVGWPFDGAGNEVKMVTTGFTARSSCDPAARVATAIPPPKQQRPP